MCFTINVKGDLREECVDSTNCNYSRNDLSCDGALVRTQSRKIPYFLGRRLPPAGGDSNCTTSSSFTVDSSSRILRSSKYPFCSSHAVEITRQRNAKIVGRTSQFAPEVRNPFQCTLILILQYLQYRKATKIALFVLTVHGLSLGNSTQDNRRRMPHRAE
jgi:hypothetical protein